MSVKLLGKQSLTYGIGHIMARLVTFLLLPLYTNVFTQEEYGIISLAYAFIGFALILYRYGMDSALMKFYVQAEDKKESESYLSTVVVLQIVSSLIFSGLVYAFRTSLSPLILSVNEPDLIAIIAGIMFFDCLWNIAALVLRAEGRPGLFVGVNLTNVMLTLGLNYYLVVHMSFGIKGVLIGNLIASGSMLTMTLPILLKRISFQSVNNDVFSKVIRFGLPFLPAGFFSMIMELSDRYLLEWISGTETVGLYSAGYKLGMFGLLLVMGFNMGWTPYFLKRGKEPNAKADFSRASKYFLGLSGFFMVLLTIWVEDVIQVSIGGISIIGESFWSSAEIIPVILLGYYFFGFYVLQLPGIYLKDQTKWVPAFRAVGAGSNIILNIILISKYGALGAAWATALAHIIMAAVIFLKSRSVYPVPMNLLGLLLPVIFIGGILWIPQTYPVKIAATALFPVIWLFLVADSSDRQLLFGKSK